jgi:ribonuclease D
VDYLQITRDDQLVALCRELASAAWIGFDTEFVSEDTYRPQLCLLQVAAPGCLAVIDTIAVKDVRPFWEVIATGDHQTIVHAGREEFLFCLNSVGQRPKRMVDVQIAAGLVGTEFPSGYGSLLQRLLEVKPNKGETRTDWRRRPLTEQQLNYALDDVRYLYPLWEKLSGRLEKHQRTAWLDAEMQTFQDELDASRTREKFWRVSGISGLSGRALAIVREVSRWREGEAERRNQPLRRVLRDDLVVELAKRRSADPKQIRAVRGMERPDLQPHYGKLAACVEKGLAIPDSECPQLSHRDWPNQITLLGQVLASALVSICHAARVAPALVGTASDVRDLVAHSLGMNNAGSTPPVLGTGWRAEIVGSKIEDLLRGRLAIRIVDPHSDDPLRFIPPAGEA